MPKHRRSLAVTMMPLVSWLLVGCVGGGGDPVAMCEALQFDCTGIGGLDTSPPAVPIYDPRTFELSVQFDPESSVRPSPVQSIVQVPCFINQGLDLKPGPLGQFAVGVAEVQCRRPTRLTLTVYLTKGNKYFPHTVVAQQVQNPSAALTYLRGEAKFPLD